MKANRITLVASIALAAILTVSLCACSAGSSSASSSGSASSAASATSNVPTSPYSQMVQHCMAQWGEPTVVGEGEKHPDGLSIAKLVDLNNDGSDELILMQSSFGQGKVTGETIHVYTLANGIPVQVLETPAAMHGTNGYFPFLQAVERPDGKGIAIITTYCAGSNPVCFMYTAYGFLDDGSFGCLAAKALTSQYAETPTYYTSSEPMTGWTPESWQTISQGEYDSMAPFTGKDVIHSHLYDMELFNSGKYPDFDTPLETLDQTLASTHETIQLLTSKAL